ncbi:LysR family transcriptional regulator [Pseudomonas sp. D8002]|uniref:LysR substrate-binding domain-containing protein n=1 Tax=unclassified Pseudomonas TaxID=196821 RepID=UPI0015A08BFE|nr:MULTISPECIES: LysR substrate-binding domain-containing protein [unclassified Pseudomonas]NWA91406.1 LysR family transcriptional regulator [Pseudomonas sp. D8002]NWB20975.1 LysR family transcriptional regulator [Pseudomonas sp. D4002]
MELRHLRYFAALAETLHFTRAAERTHVTQSTLSHQIRQLEEEVGVRLFDRIGKKVSITEAGDRLLSQVLPALKQIDVAIHAITRTPGSASGHIRIGATYSFNIRLVPACIASFLSRNPDVSVSAEELAQDLIIERLERNELDLGIAYRPTDGHDLWFEPLYNEELKLVVSTDHPLAKRKSVRMIELHNLRMTLLPRHFMTRRQLDECFRSSGAEPVVAVEMNTLLPMLELARHTDLACIVAETAIGSRSGLSVIALENPTPIRTPGLLWKKGGTDDAAIKQFASVVRKATEAGGCSIEITP